MRAGKSEYKAINCIQSKVLDTAYTQTTNIHVDILATPTDHTHHDSFSLEHSLEHLQHSELGLERGGVV